MNIKRTVALSIIGVVVIGIVLTVISPLFTPSDDEVKQKFRNLPEVQAFYERYTPDWISVEHEGIMSRVNYGVDRTWNYSANRTFSEPTQIFKNLELSVKDNLFGYSFYIACAGKIGSMNHNEHYPVVVKQTTIEGIKTTDCLETPAPPTSQ